METNVSHLNLFTDFNLLSCISRKQFFVPVNQPSSKHFSPQFAVLISHLDEFQNQNGFRKLKRCCILLGPLVHWASFKNWTRLKPYMNTDLSITDNCLPNIILFKVTNAMIGQKLPIFHNSVLMWMGPKSLYRFNFLNFLRFQSWKHTI